jgi:hypothetical protein
MIGNAEVKLTVRGAIVGYMVGGGVGVGGVCAEMHAKPAVSSKMRPWPPIVRIGRSLARSSKCDPQIRNRRLCTDKLGLMRVKSF